MNFLADIHPKIVHFPIAFLMLYPFVEFLFLITKKEFYLKAAFLFLIIGVIGAFFAVLSGNQALESLKNISISKDLFYQHQYFANITVWFFTFVLALRYYLFIKKRLDKKFTILLFVIALLGSYFVYQAGYYGGKFSNEVAKSIYMHNNK